MLTNLLRGFRWGLLTFAHTRSKKKAISERYTVKTTCQLLQNDIVHPADRYGSPTIRTTLRYCKSIFSSANEDVLKELGIS